MRAPSTVWLFYKTNGRLHAEPFGSRLAAIGRAAAVLDMSGATGLSIQNDEGDELLDEAMIAMTCQSLGAEYRIAGHA